MVPSTIPLKSRSEKRAQLMKMIIKEEEQGREKKQQHMHKKKTKEKGNKAKD